jgi:Ni/Fe-hydrogenase 1 B-type cytochrome subunit
MSAASTPDRSAKPDGDEIVRVRVWDLVVRTTHWLIALSMLVLAVTGFEIGHPVLSVPGQAGEHFVMGTVRIVHFYAAIVFTLAVLSRIAWMFVGKGHASWREFIPVAADRRAGFWPMISFYMFARRKPVPVVGHNPLAAAAYSFVFGLYVVMIVTGLGMYAIDAGDSPVAWAKGLLPIFGGITGARWIHHVTMWLLLGFFIHHFYSAVLTSVVERNGTMESIFTGTKWLPRKLVESDRKNEDAR